MMTTMWGAPLHKRWQGSRLRDPRQARFLTLASLRWVLANRAYTPWYLVRYWRLLKFKLANPHIITRGMVFLGKGVEIHRTPELAQLEIEPCRWHIGDKNTIRAHEGSLRFGDKVVLGRGQRGTQHLPRHRAGGLGVDGRLVLRVRLRPQDGRHRHADQGPGHASRARCGSGRTPLGRGQGGRGFRAARIVRPRVRARLAFCGQGSHPGLLDRGRRPGEGGEEPQAGMEYLGGRVRRGGRGAGRHRAKRPPGKAR